MVLRWCLSIIVLRAAEMVASFEGPAPPEEVEEEEEEKR